MPSTELQAMVAIEDALSGISDASERDRVLQWAVAKFGTDLPVRAGGSERRQEDRGDVKPLSGSVDVIENEVPGIAVLEPGGTLRFTIRDIKATSANDAGVRLALVAAYVHEKLTGNPEMSRRKVLNPLLEDWRIYNGNIRQAISEHRGIIGKERGDSIRLDSHAKEEAEKLIAEIRDQNTKGRWSPSAVGRKATPSKSEEQPA